MLLGRLQAARTLPRASATQSGFSPPSRLTASPTWIFMRLPATTCRQNSSRQFAHPYCRRAKRSRAICRMKRTRMFAPYVTQAKFRAQMLRDRRRQAPCRVSGRPTRPIKGLNLVLAHHQRPAVARCRVGVHRSSRMAARGAITFFGPRRGN